MLVPHQNLGKAILSIYQDERASSRGIGSELGLDIFVVYELFLECSQPFNEQLLFERLVHHGLSSRVISFMHKEMVFFVNGYPSNQRAHLMKVTTSVTS